ncbi:Signal transducing histidine kinase, homodimeric domain [compost metagenome]
MDVNRLENLLNLVGELIIDQTRLQEVNKLIKNACKNVDGVSHLDDITGHISRVVSELQDGIMKTVCCL